MLHVLPLSIPCYIQAFPLGVISMHFSPSLILLGPLRSLQYPFVTYDLTKTSPLCSWYWPPNGFPASSLGSLHVHAPFHFLQHTSILPNLSHDTTYPCNLACCIISSTPCYLLITSMFPSIRLSIAHALQGMCCKHHYATLKLSAQRFPILSGKKLTDCRGCVFTIQQM